jgi:hypothetical protein
MELSPSWEAASCAATRELPSIYGTRRFITVFPILSKINPTNTTQSYHPQIHFNIILLPTCCSS